MKVTQETTGCYSLFLEWLESVDDQEFKHDGGGVYTPALVVWLMIFQRLNEGASLGNAVEEVASGTLDNLAGQCKRTREGKVSNNTGGYSQARQGLSVKMATSVTDALFKYLSEHRAVSQGKYGRRIFSIDGAVIELLRSKELAKKYPPARRGHYPSLRMVVCHDLESGLAVRPEYGPYGGKNQQGEVALAKRIFSRLPENAIFVGDRAFGIFSVAFCAKEGNRDVIFRLTDERAKKILGKSPHAGIDEPVTWKISHHDRAKNPHLPKDATIQGRVICRNVQPNNGGKVIPLYLFTTLQNEAADTLIEIYGLRWNIETDLRTLKQTVSMHMLKVKSEDMAGKELVLGICAYNLVVAVRTLAAQRLNLPPRALSFKRTLTIIECYAPKIFAADPDKQRFLIERFWSSMSACKHPKRSRVRTEPRALVRHRRPKFPTMHGSRATARAKLTRKN